MSGWMRKSLQNEASPRTFPHRNFVSRASIWGVAGGHLREDWPLRRPRVQGAEYLQHGHERVAVGSKFLHVFAEGHPTVGRQNSRPTNGSGCDTDRLDLFRLSCRPFVKRTMYRPEAGSRFVSTVPVCPFNCFPCLDVSPEIVTVSPATTNPFTRRRTAFRTARLAFLCLLSAPAAFSCSFCDCLILRSCLHATLCPRFQ